MRMRGRACSAASSVVAMGGPLSNIFLAIMAFFAYKIFALGFLGGDLTLTLLKACIWGIVINLLLAMFNLIPIFPLDGSHVALEFLPEKWLVVYEKHIPYGMYIILGLMLTGGIRLIIQPFLGIILTLLYKSGVAIQLLSI